MFADDRNCFVGQFLRGLRNLSGRLTGRLVGLFSRFCACLLGGFLRGLGEAISLLGQFLSSLLGGSLRLGLLIRIVAQLLGCLGLILSNLTGVLTHLADLVGAIGV